MYNEYKQPTEANKAEYKRYADGINSGISALQITIGTIGFVIAMLGIMVLSQGF